MGSGKETGGFFSWEPPHFPARRLEGAALNSGRNALRYIVRAYGICSMYVPRYTCPVVWEVLKEENCDMQMYEIGGDFMPKQEFPLDAFILYTNYFGICTRQSRELALRYKHLVVDNAQAWYAPRTGMASFNSPRKFFGVPDGGFAFSGKIPEGTLPRDTSYDRCTHLLKRLDLGAEAAYAEFQESEVLFDTLPLRRMSNLTAAVLSTIDFDAVKAARRRNFACLHKQLGSLNHLPLSPGKEEVPLAYPFLTTDAGLRQKLIDHKIFAATYWPGVEKYCDRNSYGLYLKNNLVPMPLDQRYTPDDMEEIIKIVLN